MIVMKSIVVGLVLYLNCLSGDGVKIGISKPLDTTTGSTITPTATTAGAASTEEIETSPDVISSTLKTTITTTTLTTDETEWPEFPPRKQTTLKTTSTTKRPKTTTKKSKTTTTTTATPSIEANDNIAKNKSQTSIDAMGLTDHIWQNHKYCFCDMTFQNCDINCCCDPDCTPESLRVFKCLQERTQNLGLLHEGRFEDFKFKHGLPSCEVSEGWLCVFRTNVPPIVEEIPPNYSDTSSYFKWPNGFSENVEYEYKDFYMYGDILKFVTIDTRDIQYFNIPISFKPPQCQGKVPLIYLKTMKLSCLFSKREQLEEIKQNLLEQQIKLKILTKPLILEELQNPKSLQSNMANMTLRWCSENSENNCQNIDLEDSNSFIADNNNTQMMIKIHYHVFHNFTHIQGFIIDLYHAETEEDLDEFWLEYEIFFHNRTLEGIGEFFYAKEPAFKTTSGPLGYLLGKPLIITKYIPLNSSLPISENNQIMEYFTKNHLTKNAHDTLQLFGKHQGLCKRFTDGNYHELISFGINLSKQCKIRLENVTLLGDELEPFKTNLTNICLKLQNRTQYHLWGDSDLNWIYHNSYFISKLGKPQNLSEKWLPLNVVNADANPVVGQYLETSRSFVCRNILLSLNYEFYIGSYDMPEADAQNLIKHARLNIGERHDLEFGLDEVIEVPITLTIRFYNMNEISKAAPRLIEIGWVVYFIGLTSSFINLNALFVQ